MQECHEVSLLLGRESKWTDVLGEPGILHPTPIVEGDNILEGLRAAVVHVRPALVHVPQRRRLERALVGFVFGDGVPAEIRFRLVHPDADVTVALVREVESGMTPHAARLARKQREASLRAHRERGFVSRLETIVRRIAGDNRADVGGDRFGNAIGVEVGREYRSELSLIRGNGSKVLHNQLVGPVAVLEGLFLEGGPEAGPQLPITEEAVDEGWGVARRRLAGEGDRELPRIAPTVIRRMTAHTGHGAVGGPTVVPEELLPEGDLLGRHGIVVWNVCGIRIETERE